MVPFMMTAVKGLFSVESMTIQETLIKALVRSLLKHSRMRALRGRAAGKGLLLSNETT